MILSVDKSFQSEIGQIMKQKNLIKGGGKLNSPTMSLLGINNLQEIVVFFYYERLNENKFDHIFYKFLQKINSLLGHFQKKESKFFF